MSEESVKSSEWSIQKFYGKSWNLVQKYPVLWLFGLASLVLTGSGGMNFRSLSNFSDKSKSPSTIEKSSESTIDTSSNTQTVPPKVTGFTAKTQTTTTTSEKADSSNSQPVVQNSQMNLLKERVVAQLQNVPASVYMLLFMEIVVFVVIGLVVGVVGVNWSEAALYKALEMLDKKGHADITAISTHAAAYIGPGFKYTLLSFLVGMGSMFVFMAGVVVIMLVGALLTALLGPIGPIVIVVLVIGGMILAFYYGLRVSTALIWGRLYLFLENTGARGAFDRGWKLSRKGSKFKTLRLILANAILSVIAGVVALVPIAILVIIPVVALALANRFSFWALPFFLAAIFIGFPVMMFINSVMRSITAGTWYFAFQVMKDTPKAKSV